MSPLAFDKQGKAFSFLRRTKKLLVRLFKSPNARGTCCQVLGADGQPLYVDSEIDCLEFRRVVGHVPGVYRLDQCDDDGNVLDDAQPAYVSIDVPRNAQSVDGTGTSSDVNPLVIIQQMAAIQADVMKTMAAQQGAVLAAAAEILRAPYRPSPTVVETRNAERVEVEREDVVEEIEEEDDELEPEHPVMAFLRMMQPLFPGLGAKLFEKCADLVTGKKDQPAPVVVTHVVAPAPAVTPTRAPRTPVDFDETTDHGTDSDDEPEVKDASDSAPTANVTEQAPPSPSAPAPSPTAEQLMHLYAIQQQLTPPERKLAEHVITHMDGELRAHWLAKLSSMSVEEATALVRQMATESMASRKKAPR